MEKEMATHSSILAWRIPWTEEPGGLQSMGSQRVRRDWEANAHSHINLKNFQLSFKSEGEKIELSDFNLKKITWPSNTYTTKFRLLLWLSFFNIKEIYTVLTLSLCKSSCMISFLIFYTKHVSPFIFEYFYFEVL